MELKRLDPKKAHFGSRQEEWTYQSLLFLEKISLQLDRLIGILEREEKKDPPVKKQGKRKKKGVNSP